MATQHDRRDEEVPATRDAPRARDEEQPPATARSEIHVAGPIRVRKGLREALAVELSHHLPFTVVATVATLLAVGIVSWWRGSPWPAGTFASLHFVHLFVSAVATTAVSWRYRRQVLFAVFMGVTASILFCTVSDILLPFAGGRLLRMGTQLDIEAIEAPLVVLGVTLTGSAFGFVHLRYLSIYSHSLHVVASSLASLLYLLSQSGLVWFTWAQLPAVVIILFFAVFIPCCMSDLVMPVACTHCDFRAASRRSHTH